MITDASHFNTQWTMGKVVATYPGKDGLVRAVDVQTETVQPSPSSSASATIRASKMTTKRSTFRRPISKLALILSAGPDQTTSQPDGSEES